MDEATQISTVSELIATNLRRIRTVRRLPQSEIAGRMAARGWPWTAAKVSLTESNKRGITMDETADLCAALEAPLSDFLSTDDLEVTDEVAFRATVLTKAADPWGFDTGSVLKAAAEDAKRVETRRRVEGRVAKALFGQDTSERRLEVADLADEVYGRNVLAERDGRVEMWTIEAQEAGVFVEPHVYRRDATIQIIVELRQELDDEL